MSVQFLSPEVLITFPTVNDQNIENVTEGGNSWEKVALAAKVTHKYISNRLFLSLVSI